MADLEQTGVQLTVEGGESFIRSISDANKALDNLGKSALGLVSDLASGNLGRISSGLLDVRSTANDTSTALRSAAAAGSEIGLATSTASATAVAALGAVAAAAAAVVAAVAGIGVAISRAVDFGSTISQIQNVTGLSAGMAQAVYGAARTAGVPVGSLTNAFASLNARIDQTGARTEAAMGRAATATDNFQRRLERLNQDHAARLAEIEESRVERVAAINERLAEAQQSLNDRLQSLNEDLGRNIEESRRQLGERLAAIEEQHAERIAAINERIASAAQDLADRRADIQQGLTERLAELGRRAQEQIAAEQVSGAKEQEKIQESLQKELYAIEQKYQSKRQSLQEKIADPNTNPILRAFYKTQLGSLKNQEEAEKQSARDRAGAAVVRAREENARVIQAIRDRLAQQTALEEQKAAADQARVERGYQQRLAQLQAQLAREDAEYVRQGDRLRAEQGRREAELRASYQRQVADAQRTYDRQVADAAQAQAKIAAETDKRLAKEQQSYQRSLEDLQTAMDQAAARMASSGGGIAGAIDPVTRALDKLGISAAEWQKLTPDEQFTKLNDAIGTLITDGKTQEALDILQGLFGPQLGAQMLDFFKNAQDLKDLGFTQEQIDNAVKFREGVNKMGLQIDTLVAQIGMEFLPIAQRFLDKLIEFWDEHGPAVVAALKDIATWIENNVVPAVRNIWNWFTTKLLPDLRIFANWINTELIPAFNDVTTALNRDVTAALDGINKLFNDVKTTIENVARTLDSKLAAAVNNARQLWDDFRGGLQRTYDFIVGNIQRALDNLKSWLGNIRLPSFLTPGSPTPFEMGLRGIADALAQVNQLQLPALEASVAARPQEVAASPAQMASRVTTTNNNRALNLSLTVNISGNADKSTVVDGVYQALVRSGHVVVR